MIYAVLNSLTQVVFVEDLDNMSPPFATVGPIFECHPSFPQKINAEFVQVSIDHVYVLKYFNLISLLTIFMQVIFTIALQIRKNL